MKPMRDLTLVAGAFDKCIVLAVVGTEGFETVEIAKPEYAFYFVRAEGEKVAKIPFAADEGQIWNVFKVI